MRAEHGRAAQVTTHERNRLRLEVRGAVATRVAERADDTAFYLSLFDDEIDARLEALARLAEPAAEAERDHIALNLEPTDALIVAQRDGSVVVTRGGACNFPLYWSPGGDCTLVTTALPVDGGAPLSRRGLLDAVAAIGCIYRGEPNVTLRVPLAAWHRLRRGCVSGISPDGSLSEWLIDHAPTTTPIGRDALITELRSALDAFGSQQRKGRSKALVEMSGGIDSTVAAIAAIAHGIHVHGVSVHFPFYEFRFEEGIQQATADALQTSRRVLDGTTLYSYAPALVWPQLDEPATLAMTLKRAQTIAQIAAAEGTDRVYVGEGGDELFAEDMLEPMPVMEPLPRELFSQPAWNTVEQTRHSIGARPELLRRSLYTFIHDARLDVTMKELYGATTRSPFTDLAVARCGLHWARLTRESGQPHSKRILAEALADQMPEAVVHRRGKVNWFGVFARAYHEHADAIVGTFERNKRVLHHLGIDASWLTRRVGELSRWERARYGPEDAPVFACFGLATWLESWGIDDPGDHEWSD